MLFSVMLPQTNRVASSTTMRDVAQAAEELGLHGVMVHDHIGYNGWWIVSGMRGMSIPGEDRTLYEALASLSYVAAITGRVRLGVSVVVVPMREPVVLAKQLATLDALSDGRLRVGVGVGPPLKESATETTKLGRHRDNAAREYRATGVRGERGRRTDEYLRAMIEIWTNDQASFQGEFVSFENLEVFPKPTQLPHPPLYIGGRSDAALNRAALFDAGWAPSQAAASQIAEGVGKLAALRAELGRQGDAEIIANLPVVLDSTDEGAHAIARPTVRHLFADEEEYRQRTIVGSPATFVTRVRELAAVGVDHIELKPLYPSMDHFIWQLETLQSEVAPALADKTA